MSGLPCRASLALTFIAMTTAIALAGRGAAGTPTPSPKSAGKHPCREPGDPVVGSGAGSSLGRLHALPRLSRRPGQDRGVPQRPQHRRADLRAGLRRPSRPRLQGPVSRGVQIGQLLVPPRELRGRRRGVRGPGLPGVVLLLSQMITVRRGRLLLCHYKEVRIDEKCQ